MYQSAGWTVMLVAVRDVLARHVLDIGLQGIDVRDAGIELRCEVEVQLAGAGRLRFAAHHRRPIGLALDRRRRTPSDRHRAARRKPRAGRIRPADRVHVQVAGRAGIERAEQVLRAHRGLHRVARLHARRCSISRRRGSRAFDTPPPEMTSAPPSRTRPRRRDRVRARRQAAGPPASSEPACRFRGWPGSSSRPGCLRPAA